MIDNIIRVKCRGSANTKYQTKGSSGCDLVSTEEIEIQPLSWRAVPTGLYVEIPDGFEGQVRSRSGLALKSGVFVLNSPGTIDSDYRGEVKVILANFSDTLFIVKQGDRVAQLVFTPIFRAVFEESHELSSTERAAGGFGSTGKSW